LHADGRTGCLLRCLTQVDRSDLEELQLHACCAVQLADTNLRAEIQASSIGEGTGRWRWIGDHRTNPRLTRCMCGLCTCSGVLCQCLSACMHSLLSVSAISFLFYIRINNVFGWSPATILLGSCWQPKQESCCVGVVSICDAMRNDKTSTQVAGARWI
jgi:hypothetical protein